MSGLIDKGVRQFIVYDCSSFEQNFLTMLAQNRSLPKKREKTVKPEDKIVIISQDCDIHAKNQDYIEFVILRKTKTREVCKGKVLEKSRNFEKLLLPLNGSPEYGYIVNANEKCCILKVDFEKEIDERSITPWLSLLDRSKEILMKWLVNKYQRRPFPHRFNELLTFKYLKDEGDSLFNLFESHSGYINEIYFYVSPLHEEEADCYYVSITALLHSQCPSEIRHSIEQTIRKDVERIQKDQGDNKNLIMLQMLEDDDELRSIHLLEMTDYTTMPDSFYKSAEFQMLPMSVDYFCWKGSEFETGN